MVSHAAAATANTQTHACMQTCICTNVGQDAAARDGGVGEQLVELLVVADGELQVARDDADLLRSFGVCVCVVCVGRWWWSAPWAAAGGGSRDRQTQDTTDTTDTCLLAYLVVARGVAGQLEDLGRQVLEHGGEVDGRARGHAGGVAACGVWVGCGVVWRCVCVSESGRAGGGRQHRQHRQHRHAYMHTQATDEAHACMHTRTLLEVAGDARDGEGDPGLGALALALALAAGAAPACCRVGVGVGVDGCVGSAGVCGVGVCA
jgi:hypothetical protein